MADLVSLRHMRIPDEIMQAIPGVHKMKALEELTFFVGHESGHHINELNTLDNLRQLSIKSIENVADPAEAKSSNISKKTHLTSLDLKWSSEFELFISQKDNPQKTMSNSDNPEQTSSEKDNSEQIMNYLQPHQNLRKLTIENYIGQRSPSWMETSRLNSLSSLELSDCLIWKNQLLSWQMPVLKYLRIYNCPKLDKLPNLPVYLTYLGVIDVGLTSLPCLHKRSGSNTLQSLPLKSSLREVDIIRCPNLISLNGFLEQENVDFMALENITINGCENLTQLPIDSFGKLVSLNYHLSVDGCPKLTRLPNLPFAQNYFTIRNVGLSSLPEYYPISGSNSDSSASSLKSPLTEVDIECCQNLTSLNGFLQQDNIEFQTLTEVRISNCSNLIRLPIGGFSKLVSLAQLTIEDCPKLVAVDNQSNILPTALRGLSVRNCGEVVVPLLESASYLTTLNELRIRKCPNITLIPYSENAFRSLGKLVISGCCKLVKQAHGVNQQGSGLASLKINDLWIYRLSLLLIEPLRSLSFVTRFTVKNYFSKTEGLPELWFLQNSNTLRYLRIKDARTATSLPATMTNLTALEELLISNARSLEELPDLPPSLTSIKIKGARSLKSLPATMANLTALERLEIGKPHLLKELPELPTSLKFLITKGARSLKSLPTTMANLATLEEVEIHNARKLKELPELPPSLKSLTINGAWSLKSLPTTITNLIVLKRLQITDADSLKELPELPASLEMKSICNSWGLDCLPYLKRMPNSRCRNTAR